MKKPGRPPGTTKHGEPLTQKLTLRLSETAYKWVKAQPKGWLSDWIEEQAKSAQQNPS